MQFYFQTYFLYLQRGNGCRKRFLIFYMQRKLGATDFSHEAGERLAGADLNKPGKSCFQKRFYRMLPANRGFDLERKQTGSISVRPCVCIGVKRVRGAAKESDAR